MSRVFWTAVHKYHEGQLKSFLPGDELPEDLASEDSPFYKYTKPVEAAEAEAEAEAEAPAPVKRAARAKKSAESAE